MNRRLPYSVRFQKISLKKQPQHQNFPEGLHLNVIVHPKSLYLFLSFKYNNQIKIDYELESWVDMGRVLGKVTKKGWREEREVKLMSFYFNQNIKILEELIIHYYYLLSQKWLVLDSVFMLVPGEDIS